VPVQRVSLGFKDVSATFKANPINFDIITIRNENAIARSVRNLILTEPGDVPFNPNIGSNVNALLFENMDNLTAESIASEIENTIENYEPRVSLQQTIVTPIFDDNEFNVRIVYDIIGINVPTQELEFVLLPTR
jgi:phage baseplate assembly protein W